MTPRWLRLLVRVLPPDTRDEVLRELSEQHQRVATRGRLARWQWAWRQVPVVLAWRDAGTDQSWWSGVFDDWRVARRALVQRPSLAVTVIGTVAICVAAITAVAGIVHAVVLRPLPYPQEDQLVWLASYQPSDEGKPFDPASAASAYGNPMDVADWAARTRTIRALTPFELMEGTVIADGRPVRVSVAAVSAEVGEVLGIRAAHGRLFTEEDYAEGRNAVVLSHRLWRSAFGGDPGIVNALIDGGGLRYRVIGVLPDLPVMFPNADIDLWRALPPPAPGFQNRGGVWQRVVGRMADGVTLAQAQDDMSRVARELEQAYPRTNEGRRVYVVPYRDGFIGSTWSVLQLLVGAVGLVMVIACVNVGHLLLVSAQGRRRELAVRTALGAQPWRVARLLCIESLWLCGLGGVLGLALAPWALRTFLVLYPESLPSVGTVALEWTAAAVALAATLLAAILSAVPPLWSSRARDVQPVLRSGDRGAETRTQRRLRAGMVVTQVALSTALLVGGGLLVRTFLAMRAVDAGLHATGVLTFNVALSPANYPTLADEARFHEALREDVLRLPGVTAVGMSTLMPFAFGEFGDGFLPVGVPLDPGETAIARLQNVTPGFFAAVGLPLRHGRDFTVDDREGAPPVAIVNEALQARYFPEGALGRQIRFRGVTHDIVGVVADKRHRNLRETPRPEMYYPRAQVTHPRLLNWVAVRTTREPMGLLADMRAAVARLDPAVAIDDPASLVDRIDRVLAPDRFRAALVGALAIVALLLAGLGLYGLVAYTVSKDARTIAIRMALGALARQTAGRVVRDVAILTLWGVVCGAVLAWAGHTLVVRFLAGVEPLDPVTLLMVACALALVATAAAAGPARRASKVDPAEVLRSQ